jgi:hypothetical protein
MARKRRVTRTQVTANLPNSVELTKLNSRNSMTVEIRTGNLLLGTLVMGRGSVQWWPRGNSVHALKKSWRTFAAMLDEHM